MKYGRFADGGRKYEITTPNTPGVWSNHLFNDDYYMEISQTLQGTGSVVKDYNRTPCLSGYRYFYLHDRESGEVWNPNYVPLAKEPDRYLCRHGIRTTELRSCQQGIETTIRVTVPREGSREVWSVSVRNQEEHSREISLYSVFGFYDHGVMGGECGYDEDSGVIFKYAYPYHTLYEEKEKVEKEKAYAYLFSDRRPDSCEMSRLRFFGDQGEYGIPEGVKRGRLSGIKAEAEDFCGAFSYELHIEAGGEISLILETGAASGREEVLARKAGSVREEVLARKAGSVREQAEKEFAETDSSGENLLDGFYMETPDENLNAFGNYWLKKQVTLMTRQNRGSSYCPVRNQLQDAMGYALVSPEDAKRYILDILKLQRREILLETIKELDTPFGPLILSKPFESWDSRWGRLSVKKSGTTENGSVYCHASMFLAFARAVCGDGDGLYELLWRTLPTNPENPPEKNRQVPVYLANYYYGLRDSENFGRSSCHYGTGTAPWMLMLLIEELMGVRAGVDGLRLEPCLPAGWERVSVCRRFRNAEYRIVIKKGDKHFLTVDGEPYEKEILPFEENRSYRVELTIV